MAHGFAFADNPRPIMIRSLMRWARDLLEVDAPQARQRGDAAAMVARARQTLDLCILAVLVAERKRVPDECFFHGALPPQIRTDGLSAYKNILQLDHGPSRILVDRIDAHPGFTVADGDEAVAAALGVVATFSARYAPDLTPPAAAAAPALQPPPAWLAAARAQARVEQGLDDDEFG